MPNPMAMSCINADITPYPIANQSYNITDPGLPVGPYLDWTDTDGTCGPYTYTSVFANGSAFPIVDSFITFDAPSLTYTLQTNDFGYPDGCNYLIMLKGTLTNGYYRCTLFQVTLINPCLHATLTPSSVTPQTLYVR